MIRVAASTIATKDGIQAHSCKTEACERKDKDEEQLPGASASCGQALPLAKEQPSELTILFECVHEDARDCGRGGDDSVIRVAASTTAGKEAATECSVGDVADVKHNGGEALPQAAAEPSELSMPRERVQESVPGCEWGGPQRDKGCWFHHCKSWGGSPRRGYATK